MKPSISTKEKKKKKVYVLFSIEVIDPQIFIPNEYVVVCGYNIWMEKSLRIPPIKREKSSLFQTFNVLQVAKLLLVLIGKFHWSSRHLASDCLFCKREGQNKRKACRCGLDSHSFVYFVKETRSKKGGQREKMWYHLACFLALMWMARCAHSNSLHSFTRPS